MTLSCSPIFCCCTMVVPPATTTTTITSESTTAVSALPISSTTMPLSSLSPQSQDGDNSGRNLAIGVTVGTVVFVLVMWLMMMWAKGSHGGSRGGSSHSPPRRPPDCRPSHYPSGQEFWSRVAQPSSSVRSNLEPVLPVYNGHDRRARQEAINRQMDIDVQVVGGMHMDEFGSSRSGREVT